MQRNHTKRQVKGQVVRLLKRPHQVVDQGCAKLDHKKATEIVIQRELIS